jgi:hypothetical protein
MESTKMFSMLGEEATEIYTITKDGQALSINGMPALGTDYDIPLNFKASVQAQYGLSFEGINDLANTNVYIEDLFTGNTQDLRQNPIYTFDAVPGDPQARFVIHFTNSAFGIGEVSMEEASLIIRNYGNSFEVVTLDNSTISRINVYNVMGSKVYSTDKNVNSRITPSAAGVYIVEVYTEKGVSKDKVVIR